MNSEGLIEGMLQISQSQQKTEAVIKAKDTVSFELLKKSDAKALNLREGHPGVRVDRLAFDISGMVVEFRTSVGDAMAFQYSAEVN